MLLKNNLRMQENAKIFFLSRKYVYVIFHELLQK